MFLLDVLEGIDDVHRNSLLQCFFVREEGCCFAVGGWGWRVGTCFFSLLKVLLKLNAPTFILCEVGNYAFVTGFKFFFSLLQMQL